MRIGPKVDRLTVVVQFESAPAIFHFQSGGAMALVWHAYTIKQGPKWELITTVFNIVAQATGENQISTPPQKHPTAVWSLEEIVNLIQ